MESSLKDKQSEAAIGVAKNLEVDMAKLKDEKEDIIKQAREAIEEKD